MSPHVSAAYHREAAAGRPDAVAVGSAAPRAVAPGRPGRRPDGGGPGPAADAAGRR